MSELKVIENRERESLWPEVSFYRSDFRPHFDGDLVNVSTFIQPTSSKLEVMAQVEECATKIADWVLSNRSRFDEGDRFQIVVGYSKGARQNARQIIKDGGDRADLKLIVDNKRALRYLSAWSEGVCD